MICFAVVEVFGPDEADDGVDEQRPVAPGDRVGPRLHGLLVDAVVRLGREGAALAGFEIHDVVAQDAAVEGARGLVRLVQDGQADAEGAVRRFAARDGLEDEVDRPAPVHDVEQGGDMGEHAGLGRDLEARPQLVDQLEQEHRLSGAVGRRIDADHRIAAAVHEAIQDGGADALRIVGRMVGLEADGEASRQPDGVAEFRDDPDLPSNRDQVLVAHQLRDRGRHLRRHTQREFLESLRGCRIRKEPVSERPDGHRRHGRECCGIMAVEDESRDFIGFAGDNRLVEKAAQRNVRPTPCGPRRAPPRCRRRAQPSGRRSGPGLPAPGACAGRRTRNDGSLQSGHRPLQFSRSSGVLTRGEEVTSAFHRRIILKST